ncbi:50S ribosomal protein L20 [Candidatus Phytoplasma australiense]|uniref:Large ribosomal subunit protein bL20 n=1 Tax=Strawberry lethal yellows phytoplasma (CPA) str. NZSb11 TaxID=980422 RepID=R4RMY0_PHYAS|nr:50S ribosomal protein L20 [Candidatus Phytoplasma australiense]AGL90705.1 50S ribosomal protein L20 [Strawberry lethal yellows phytoplasma (CPA) str. NZSb11]
MAKVNFAPARHQRRKKVLKMAKGYFGSKSTLYKTAHEQVMRSLQYAYRDRKQRKRDFRKLWITRINAGGMSLGIKYSRLMHGLSLAKVDIDRKTLAGLAHLHPEVFSDYVNLAKSSLEQFQKELENKKKEKVVPQVPEKKTKQMDNKEQTLQTEKQPQIQKLDKEVSKAQVSSENKESNTPSLESSSQELENPKITKEEQKPKINQQSQKVEKKELSKKIEKQPNKETELNQAKPKEEKNPQKTTSQISVDKLSKMLLTELKQLAKEYQISGVNKLKKSEIIEILKKTIKENNK